MDGSSPLPLRKTRRRLAGDILSILWRRLKTFNPISTSWNGFLPKNPVDRFSSFPIRFIFTNKINKDDKILLAFDALVLSEVLGREVGLGKIIHGEDHVRAQGEDLGSLAARYRSGSRKSLTLMSRYSPPDLILNRHCAECEFKARCRQKAIETDDLSLLSAMTEKERSRHRSKGIFTVNQLSYTFRPRKTPKRAKNPAKPHYVALQALSIRENTVYVHGDPQPPRQNAMSFWTSRGFRTASSII